MSSEDRAIGVIRRVFNARSVALVGASQEPTKYGFMTLNSIIRGGFQGEIYPVNPRGGEILGRKVYPSVGAIPGRPDLVIIIVPVNLVAGVLREAGQMGVPAALIATGGFRESGRLDLESELLCISREYGIRIIGPNIAGINYLPNKLCAMFFPVITTFGPIGIISQSGTITNGLSEWAAYEGIGISAAINLGNQIDLCESDFLDFLSQDDPTRVIAMYLDGVKDGRRFMGSLARATARKPVVILKGGRTHAGQRSASSHTSSMAVDYRVFSAACIQSGAVLAEDLETLFDCSKALAMIRPPKGKRVLTVSTSGGANTAAMDEAEKQDLAVPPLGEEFLSNLKNLNLSPLAALSNPLDLVSLSAEEFRKVFLLADKLDAADLFLINYGDPVEGASEAAEEIRDKVGAGVAVSYFAGGEEEKQGRIKIQAAGIPVFPTPERAIRGLASVCRAATYREGLSKRGGVITMDSQRFSPSGNVDRTFLTEPEGIQYLESYGIPYPPHGMAATRADAVEVAEKIGYPVVLKIVSPEILHKTEIGGVLKGLTSAQEVGAGFDLLISRARSTSSRARIQGVLVCRQLEEGPEAIIGSVEDAVFGPLIMFGLGGIFAEIFNDVAIRVLPIHQSDAEEMIQEIKGYPLLKGARGGAQVKIENLVQMLMSVSRLVEEKREIKELDLNPVHLSERCISALDVRIILGRR